MRQITGTFLLTIQNIVYNVSFKYGAIYRSLKILLVMKKIKSEEHGKLPPWTPKWIYEMGSIVKLIFARKNTNVAGGNFSFKTTDKNGKEYIIMTPTMMSEAYLGEVSPAQILVVEPHTREVIDGVGKLTREINLHEAVYDTNPEIKAVLHAHAPNSMFWATAGLDMPNLTEATQKIGYVPVLDFEPNCSPELAELVSDYMVKEKLELPNMLLLNSHDP